MGTPDREGVALGDGLVFIGTSDARVVAATVDHDGPLVAAVEAGPVAGAQFHPERSGEAGARVLENLVRWSSAA